MKKMFLTLGTWISSFFSKKSEKKVESSVNELFDVESKIIDSETKITFAPTTKTENHWVTKTDEQLISEPEISKDLLDLQVQKDETIFSISKDKTLTISSGETFELTEKQLVFYNIIKELQELKQSSSANILVAYLKHRFNNLPHSEIAKMTQKQNLSSHGKTMKGMFKSGLLERVSRNEYRVKI